MGPKVAHFAPLLSCSFSIVSLDKHEEISQRKLFLSLLINFIYIGFEIPHPKLNNFVELLKQVKSWTVMPVRLLASFRGKLNSFSRALGQVVRLMTRNLHSCLKPPYSAKEGWDSVTSLSISAREQLIFWELNIVNINSFAITPVTPSITTCELLAGDASGEGLYSAKFSDKSETIYSRKILAK